MKKTTATALVALALSLTACAGRDTTVSYLGMQLELRGDTLMSDGIALSNTRWEQVTLTAEITELAVNTGTGEISLTGASTPTTTVEVFIASEIEGDGTPVVENGVLRIGGGTAGKAVIDSVRGTVPNGSALTVRSGIGHIVVSDFQTALDVHVESGIEAVELRDGASGELTVVGGTGPIDITTWSATRVSAQSGTGHVSLAGVTAESARLVSGTEDIILADSTLDRGEIETGTGDIHLVNSASQSSLHCTSGTGDVTIKGGAIEGLKADLALGSVSRSEG